MLERVVTSAQAAHSVPPTMVVFAHPDDEVIGLGSLLPRLRDAVFVHVTDGSPRDLRDCRSHGLRTREEYAQLRRRELAGAFAIAGVDAPNLVQLDVADREAALNLPWLALRLAASMWEHAPELVITHPYEGGHPDHDATAFAVHAAQRALARRGGPVPLVAEACSYHQGPNGIEVGSFLPHGEAREWVRVLGPEERARKRLMLDGFVTQRATLRWFRDDEERFRIAPAYDFTRAPHRGPLFYERFDWGMSGERFTALAGAALRELGRT